MFSYPGGTLPSDEGGGTRIAAAKDDIEDGRILQEAIGLLKDGHTNDYPNALAPQDTPLVHLEPIEGKAFIRRVLPWQIANGSCTGAPHSEVINLRKR